MVHKPKTSPTPAPKPKARKRSGYAVLKEKYETLLSQYEGLKTAHAGEVAGLKGTIDSFRNKNTELKQNARTLEQFVDELKAENLRLESVYKEELRKARKRWWHF